MSAWVTITFGGGWSRSGERYASDFGPGELHADAPCADAGAPPAAVAAPVGRGIRGVPWLGFQLATICTKGEQIGWGCVCNRHLNAGGDGAMCKKQIHYGRDNLSDRACIVAMKRWLIRGFEVSPYSCQARFVHRDMDARSLADESISDATLDAQLVAARAAAP